MFSGAPKAKKINSAAMFFFGKQLLTLWAWQKGRRRPLKVLWRNHLRSVDHKSSWYRRCSQNGKFWPRTTAPKTPWWMEKWKYFWRGTRPNRFCAYTNIVPAKYLYTYLCRRFSFREVQLQNWSALVVLTAPFQSIPFIIIWESTTILQADTRKGGVVQSEADKNEKDKDKFVYLNFVWQRQRKQDLWHMNDKEEQEKQLVEQKGACSASLL